MNSYECTIIYDATRGCTVEAESVEAAADAAYEHADASLCHQCAGHLDLGDAIGVIVYQDGKEVCDTTYSTEQITKLRAENERLRQALRDAGIALDGASA